MNRNDAMRKVQALLAKAESTHFEAEAEALVEKARALMEQHSIDEMSARMRGDNREKPVTVHWEFSSSDSNARGKAQVLSAACKATGVKLLMSDNRRGMNRGRARDDGTKAGVASQWCWMTGFEGDVAMAKMLYASLLLQAQRFGMQAWHEYSGATNVGKSAFLTAFFIGFAQRVHERLSDRRPKAEENTRAIVLARDSEVDAAFNSRFPKTRNVKSNAGNSWAGRAAGRIAGDRADLGGERIGGHRKALN